MLNIVLSFQAFYWSLKILSITNQNKTIKNQKYLKNKSILVQIF